MSGCLCYVSRTSRGAALAGLTLVDGRETRVWTAPRLADDVEPDAEVLAASAGAGAAWLARQLVGAAGETADTAPTLTICLDVDGGRCGWLTSVGGSQNAVLTAVQEAGSEPLEEGATGALGGAIWSPTEGEPGTDLSVQGLTTTVAAPVKRGLVLSRAKDPADQVAQRLAVLALPDLAARLLLDELDRLGVRVHAVTTLWHVMARAWDPSQAEALARSVLAPTSDEDDPLVSRAEPVTAIVLLEPSGRLAWAWARGGALVAAGSQRLRLAFEPVEADGVQPPIKPEGVLEVTRTDLARTINEWLSWSLQVSAAPTRIVCLGPSNIAITDLRDHAPAIAGAGVIAETLAAAWPGSVATAAVEDTPVIATLARIASASGAAGITNASDPRSAVLELSERPGRFSRTTYGWIAAAVCAAGVGVFALASKLFTAASATEATIQAVKATRQEKIDSVKQIVERLSDPATDVPKALQSKLTELERRRQTLVPERPVLLAFARLLGVAGAVPEVKLHKSIRVSSLNTGISADFAAKLDNADALPKILTALRAQNDGFPVIWEGNPKPTGKGDERIYEIRGTWDKKILAEGAAKPGGAGGAVTTPAAGPNVKPSTLPATGTVAPVNKSTPPAATVPVANPVTPPTKPAGVEKGGNTP